MKDGGKLVQVHRKMKEIDTLLYEIERDYRVSGHPVDNNLMQMGIRNIKRYIITANKRLSAIWHESVKSPVTGEEK